MEHPSSISSTRFHSSSVWVIVVFVSILTIFLHTSSILVGAIGINYGQIANNLPPPEKVVPLLKSVGATRVKLYDADPRVLHAFANTGIEFVIGLGNEYLSTMANDQSKADSWVKTNVKCFLPATKITCITIGNEVLTFNDTSLSNCLLPAMKNIHTSLVNLGLDKQVTITTAHSLAVLETSYPPSAGSFRKDLKGCVTQILEFQSQIGSPFLINAYPYFAYKANPKQVSLDYVLFQPNQGVLDPTTNLKYDNMLFAQIDAVHAALTSMGFKKLPVLISETGWPSKGDEDEAGASPENAMKYNGNLMKMLKKKTGTPMRPDCDLNVYVFALFNENLKPGPSSERNYGLFKPDGTPAYQLAGTTTASGSANNNNASGGGGRGGSNGDDSSSQPAPDTSANDYLSISSGTKMGFEILKVGAGVLSVVATLSSFGGR